MTTLLPKKNTQNFGPISQSMTKHRMFRATNLRRSREFYTNAVGDVGDIQKVWCIAELTLTISSTENHLFLYQSLFPTSYTSLPLPIPSTKNHLFLLYGLNDVGYCWPPSDQESSLSVPGHFEQGMEYVEYHLPSLTIPSTQSYCLLVYCAKIMLVIGGLPLTLQSIRIHLCLVLHFFNRVIALLDVADLLPTILFNRNHLCLLNDSLN